MLHTVTETSCFFLSPLINKHFAFLKYGNKTPSLHETNWMNSEQWSWDNLPGGDYERNNNFWEKLSQGSVMTVHTFQVLCSNSRDCVNVMETLLYFSSPSCWDIFLSGQDSCLPCAGWKITIPQRNAEEGKEKVVKNQMADWRSRCLCWIGPYFCLTSLGKPGFTQIKVWQDEIKHCFTVPHLTCSS